MDACLTVVEWPTASKSVVARIMIRCIVPVLDGSSPQDAQILINCIRLLSPKCDLRQLQALTHFRRAEYVEAMQVLAELNTMSALAITALCQREIGDPSWVGSAQIVCDSQDEEAIAIVAPWAPSLSVAEPSLPHALAERARLAVADDVPYIHSSFLSLKA